MSYIPDYRHEVDKLSGEDRMYAYGYRQAIEDMRDELDNIREDAELSVEKEVLDKYREELEMLMECDEVELVCSLFEHADYLPDDIELTDARSFKTVASGSEEGDE